MAISRPDEVLTPRQIEVLRLVAMGKTNEEIANDLCISVYTVEGHLKDIYAKLGVTNRTQATRRAFLLGLVAVGVGGVAGLAAGTTDRSGSARHAQPVGVDRYRYVLERVRGAEPRLRGPEQKDALAEIDGVYPAFDSALNSFLRFGQYGDAAALVTGATWFLHIRGHLSEGIDWFARILEISGEELPPLSRAQALNGAGLLLWGAGKYSTARERLDESLQLQIDQAEGHGLRAGLLSSTLSCLGGVERAQSNFGTAQTFYNRRMALCEMVKDWSGIATTLQSLGLIALGCKEYGDARRLFEQGVTIHFDRAKEKGAEPESRSIGYLRNNLGHTCAMQEAWTEALGHYRESLTRLDAIGDKAGVLEAILGHAAVVSARGCLQGAALLLGVADSIRDQHEIAFSTEVQPVTAYAEGRLAAAIAAERVTAAAITAARDHGRQEGLATGLSHALSYSAN